LKQKNKGSNSGCVMLQECQKEQEYANCRLINQITFNSPIGFVFIHVFKCTIMNVYAKFGGPRCY